jgi:hypothetical protein
MLFMIKNKISLFIIFCLLLNQYAVFAQENDFESWNEIGISKKITKQLQAELSSEIRFNDNATDFNKILNNIGLNYKIIKGIQVSAFYRYTRSFDYKYGYQNEHSGFINIEYQYKIKRFELSLRTRYQRNYKNEKDAEVDVINRNKVSLSYDIYKSPFIPFISFETFVPLNATEGLFISKNRYFAGCKYKINSTNSFAINYGIQQEMNKKNPVRSYILGLSYGYKF